MFLLHLHLHLLLLLLLLNLPHQTLSQSSETGIILPGQEWLDTNGSRVYAGGANVVWEPSVSRFFMVGEGNKTHQDCSECFNLYSSPDLSSSSWRFEGCVLKNEDIRAAAPAPFNNVTAYPFYRMERPKVFRCPTTKNTTDPYRLVFHCDTSNFAMTSIGILTAPSITGPYTFSGQCFKPDGRASYDMGVFIDDTRMPGGDGRAYLVRSVENSFAGISQFDDECLQVTGIISDDTPKMEGQAIMRDSLGTLHMIGSHETGWSPNAAIFLTSPNVSLVNATWINAYNPSGSGSTYDSQSTFILPFHRQDGSVVHIYLGDRWNEYGPGSLQNMTEVWLPLLPPSGPPPTNVQIGWQLQTSLCNASDPTQQLSWHLNGTVTHAASGLCLAQGPSIPDQDVNIFTDTCSGSNNTPIANQTWFKTGAAFSNTSFGFGNGCSNWNAGNGFALGAPIMLYRCGNQTQWNSRYDTPLTPDTPGLFQGIADISATGYCLVVRPQHDPSLWFMPFFDSWRIADINVSDPLYSISSSTLRFQHSFEEKKSPRSLAPIKRHFQALPLNHPEKNAAAASPSSISILVNDTTPLRRFSGESFLSVNIDTGSLFHSIDLNDPVLVNFMYSLTMNTGSLLRVGGTAADYSIYVPESTDPTGGNSSGSVTVISDAILDSLFSFAAQSHANVLFDLNARQFRTSEGAWDPSGNASALLQRLSSRYSGGAIDWSFELGNEPEFWGQNVNYSQLGLDVVTLSKLLSSLGIGKNVYGASFGTLDTTKIEPFLVSSKGYLQGLTVHDYPLGRNCSLAAFLDRSLIDQLQVRLRSIANLTRSIAEWYVELSLEEISAAYDGGCEGLTDRFADGFFFQSSLAAVAAAGFDRYSRQDLAGFSFTQGESHYQLAGPPGWTNGSLAMRPHPSWFTAMLFKQLVGTSVLRTNLSGDVNLLSQVTVSAWCPGSPWWFNDALILSFSNPTGADVTLSFAVTSGGLTSVPRTEYILTSSATAITKSKERLASGKPATLENPMDPPASLSGDDTYLNGILWLVDSNGILPAASPVPGADVNDPTQAIVFPPYSHGFIRFPGNGIKAC